MGCVQAKSLTQSSPGGLEKLKMESGYVGKGGIVGPRRSTGQTYPERELGTKQYRAKPGIINDDLGMEEKGEGNGGNVSKRVSLEDEELADGWPQWLLKNVSKEVLVGLVPKSAESYDKLDKVCYAVLISASVLFFLVVCE